MIGVEQTLSGVLFVLGRLFNFTRSDSENMLKFSSLVGEDLL
jgi:hypothetical protein